MGVSRNSSALPAILNLSLIKLNEGLGLFGEVYANAPRADRSHLLRM